MEAKIKPALKGTASFILPKLRTTHSIGGTNSAQHCYSLFLRHYALLEKAGAENRLGVVAELGPGSSIGMGLAALIAGAERYFALDLVDHTNDALNIRIFDELVNMFRSRSPVPCTGRHSTTFPYLDSYEFPGSLNHALEVSLSSDRLSGIRRDIAAKTGTYISVHAPWTSDSLVKERSVDWIFSHSVLEHIDDFEGAYDNIYRWLNPGGVVTSLIDFYSHDLTVTWNGHWAIGSGLWFLIRGKRPYLLNRSWCSQHIDVMERIGFRILLERREMMSGGLPTCKFSEDFRMMSERDAHTRMAFFVATAEK